MFSNLFCNDIPLCQISSSNGTMLLESDMVYDAYVDGSFSAKFDKLENKIRWEDELTGKNSVIPCINERIKISIINWEVKLKHVFLMTTSNS